MTPSIDFSGFQIGLAMGAASMISIGPNNLMLLREGLVGGRSGLVAGLVWASYGVLISIAVLIAATSFRIDSSWQAALCWAGLAALCWFAFQSFRAALGRQSHADLTMPAESLSACLGRVLRVVWLNPLTYVELLLIPAALGRSMTANTDRIEFATALLVTSAVCCFGYAYGGNLIARFVQSRRNIRIFDFASGVILTAISASLVASLVSANA